MDVEQVLNVPVLHMIDEDLTLSKFLEQVSIQEIPEVQVALSGASMVQEQVIVQSLPEVPVHVLHQRVQQRTVEQVVDAHVPQFTVSGRIVEQVVDAPVSRGLPLRRARVQQRTGSSTAALDLAEEHLDGFFSHSSPAPKKCEDWAAVECGSGAALELIHASASGRLIHGCCWQRVGAIGYWPVVHARPRHHPGRAVAMIL